jgi:hypothetical protein
MPGPVRSLVGWTPSFRSSSRGVSSGAPAGAHYRFIADYPNDKADIVFRYDRIEADYNPALGFVPQRGIERFAGQFSLSPRPKRATLIRRFEFQLLNYDIVQRIGGGLDNANFSVRPLGVQFQSGDQVNLTVSRRFDGPTADFDLVPGATVRAGDYWWNQVGLQYSGSNVRTWGVSASVVTGTFYDGDRTDLTLSYKLRLQPHVELNFDWSRNEVSLPSAEFVANTMRFRGDYAFSPRLTATAFVQFDDQSDRAAVNARVRWTTSPGSDLYVVWNNTWPTGLERGIPWDRPLRGALVAKYVRFFRL